MALPGCGWCRGEWPHGWSMPAPAAWQAGTEQWVVCMWTDWSEASKGCLDRNL